MTDELDTVICRSSSVRIQIDSDGKVQRPTDLRITSPPPIRLTAEIQNAVLKIEAIKIAKSRHMSLDPGLALTGNWGIDVINPEGRNLRSPFGSGSLAADRMRSKYVPQGEILGYVFECNPPLIAGQYQVSVKFPKDLWIDQKMDAKDADADVHVNITDEQFR